MQSSTADKGPPAAENAPRTAGPPPRRRLPRDKPSTTTWPPDNPRPSRTSTSRTRHLEISHAQTGPRSCRHPRPRDSIANRNHRHRPHAISNLPVQLPNPHDRRHHKASAPLSRPTVPIPLDEWTSSHHRTRHHHRPNTPIRPPHKNRGSSRSGDTAPAAPAKANDNNISENVCEACREATKNDGLDDSAVQTVCRTSGELCDTERPVTATWRPIVSPGDNRVRSGVAGEVFTVSPLRGTMT